MLGSLKASANACRSVAGSGRSRRHAARLCSVRSAYSRHWSRPRKNANATAGTAKARSQAATSSGQAVGSTCRATTAAPRSPARSMATPTTGASMRRVTGVASRSRASRRTTTAVITTNTRTTPSRSQEPIHERRLAVEHEERVRRAVAHAARVRARHLEGLGHEQARQEQHDHHGGRRERDQPIAAVGEPAAGERQEEVDQERLDQPACEPAHRVEQLVVRLGERGDEPRRAGGDEEQPEALGRAPVPRVQPDGERDADHEAAGQRHESGLLVCAYKRDLDRDRHGRDRGQHGGEQRDASAAACRRTPVHDRDNGTHVRSLTIGAASACERLVTSPEPSA